MRNLLLPTLFCLSPLVAQGAKGAKEQPKPAPAPATAPAAPAAAPAPDDITVVKQVPYQPTVSREPFQVLGDSQVKGQGDYVDDIAVKGCLRKEGKLFAIVADSRGNVRWLEAGYRFKDGMIDSIDDKSVTFRQWDPNSTNPNVFRKVVKTFKREEAKR
jgi:hypothetical protein